MKNAVFYLLAMVLFSCGGETKKEDLASLKDEVMDVHDEVMPKMGALMKAKKQLLKKAESQTDSLKIMKYLEVANQIDVANESMMDWMRNYDPNFTGNVEAIKAYLDEKKQSIEKVKSDMLAALLAGEQSLQD